MPTRTLTLLLAALCLALPAACGRIGGDAAAGLDVLWPERAVVYRIAGGQGRLEAYSIRGGVAPLGSVELPGGLHPVALTLDAGGGRVIVWGERGGAVVDGRTLALGAAWQEEAARPDDVPPRQLTDGQPSLARRDADVVR